VLTRFLLPSVATNLEAVKPDKVRLVPEAAPMFGVVKLGLEENTTFPVPVLLL